MNEQSKIIAIDGPSASGKSTVSKAVAKQFGFFYVDSGAMYRGVTWDALRNGIDPEHGDAVTARLAMAQWAFRVEDGASVFSIDGITPVAELRDKATREAVADVAAIPAIREFVVQSLRNLSELGSLVMEGRDITTVVFPDTPYKFYLDADPEERAMRRYRELVDAGESEKAEDVLASLKRRDTKDQSRETAPLQLGEGVHKINSTSMGLDEVIQTVIDAVGGTACH